MNVTKPDSGLIRSSVLSLVLDGGPAAQLYRERPALVCRGDVYSFSWLAEAVKERAKLFQGRELLVVDATNTIETVVEILAAFEYDVPFTVLTKHQRSVVDIGTPVDSGVACVMYTSGSTASPKGVLLSQMAMMKSAQRLNSYLGLDGGDRWIAALPLNHIGGLMILVRCQLVGACIELHDGFSEGDVALSIADGANVISVVPTMLERLLDFGHHELLARMKTVLVGGAPLVSHLVTRCRTAQLPLVNTYGMTETCSGVAVQNVAAGEDGFAPLSGIGVSIVGPDEEGVGAIEISGDSILDGYEGRMPVHGRFQTSDLGRMNDDNRFMVVGRVDDLIITGGHNVAPVYVEDTLRAMEGVSDCIVFGVNDELWGQVVAIGVQVTDSFDMARFTTDCRKHLAAHERPRRIAVIRYMVYLDNGKPDRHQMKEQLSLQLQKIVYT